MGKLEEFGIGPYYPTEILEGIGSFLPDIIGPYKLKRGYDAMRAAGAKLPSAYYPLGATVGGGTLMDLLEGNDEEELETIYVD